MPVQVACSAQDQAERHSSAHQGRTSGYTLQAFWYLFLCCRFTLILFFLFPLENFFFFPVKWLKLFDILIDFFHPCSHNVCLCKPNNLFAYSSWVTFYQLSGEYEQAIAYGLVQTINQSGVAQIKVFAINSEEKNILEYINNEKANILVRPSLTTEAIKIIANYV